MADDQKTRLERVARDSPDPQDRKWAMGELRRLHPSEYPAQAAPPPTGDKAARIKRGIEAGHMDPPSTWDKVKTALNPADMGTDVLQGLKNMQSGFTLGGADAFNDALGVDSPQARGQYYQQAERAPGPNVETATRGIGAGLSAITPHGPLNTIGRGMTGLLGMVESKIPALASRFAGRLLGHAGVGYGVGGTAGVIEAKNAGADWLEALHEGNETGKMGALMSGVLGPTGELVGRGSNTAATAIRSENPDIAILERAGASPSPVPFRPVANAPSKAMGVRPTSEGRGIMGERAASRIQGELDFRVRDQVSRAGRELETAVGKQGDRRLSVEPYITAIDAELARKGVEMDPGMVSSLKRARRMLTGELEPTAEIYTATPQEQVGSVGSVTEKLADPFEIHPANVQYNESGRIPVETPEPDPNYGVHKRVPYDPYPTPGQDAPSPRPIYRGGERLVRPPGPEEETYTPLNRWQQTLEPEYTVSAGGAEPIEISHVEHPGFQTRATSVDPGEAIKVGVGDVRGRVGDAPNYTMSAADLNQIRIKLDEAVFTAKHERGGVDKASLPIYRIANEIRRNGIRREAPAIGQANRRSHTVQDKLTRTKERLLDNTEQPETLGMQLTGIGEEGSKHAGTRRARLGDPRDLLGEEKGKNLRAQFPREPFDPDVDSRPGFMLNENMDAPRLLLAEERQELKKMPRIGSGGTDKMNWRPLMSRGVYPAMNELGMAFGELQPPAQAGLQVPRTAGQMLLETPEPGGFFGGPQLPGFIPEIDQATAIALARLRAAEQQRQREQEARLP